MSLSYFDSHSHVNDEAFASDELEVVTRMQNAGIGAFVVGTDVETSKNAVQIAEKYDGVYAVVGLHPTDTNEMFVEEDYSELAQQPKTVAIGECGLDYFVSPKLLAKADFATPKNGDAEAEKSRQKKNFEAQLEFAVTHDLPLMIHCRDAHEDMLEILELKKAIHGEKLRGNIHFFTGSTEIAHRYIALNFTLSFTGVVTFAREYDEMIRSIPRDMILSETDCPYAAPVPYRGKRNEPLYVVEVVKKLAEIRGENVVEFRQTVLQSTTRVFGVDV